jgi:hypothetical protein
MDAFGMPAEKPHRKGDNSRDVDPRDIDYNETAVEAPRFSARLEAGGSPPATWTYYQVGQWMFPQDVRERSCLPEKLARQFLPEVPNRHRQRAVEGENCWRLREEVTQKELTQGFFA